jgi:hypothetical protein
MASSSGSLKDPDYLKVKNLDGNIVELRSKLSDLINTSWSTEKFEMKFLGMRRRRSTRKAFYNRVCSRLDHRGDAS